MVRDARRFAYSTTLESKHEPRDQIQALVDRATTADAAAKDEFKFDNPGEVARREMCLETIHTAKVRFEERWREADRARGRSEDD